MTTLAAVAQAILDENGWATTDFSGLTIARLEAMLDDIIDYVNERTGLSIAHLSGSSGTKSLVYTAPQNVAIKKLAVVALHAYKEKGDTASVGGFTFNNTIDNPDFKVALAWAEQMLTTLKSPPIYISNDPVPT